MFVYVKQSRLHKTAYVRYPRIAREFVNKANEMKIFYYQNEIYCQDIYGSLALQINEQN